MDILDPFDIKGKTGVHPFETVDPSGRYVKGYLGFNPSDPSGLILRDEGKKGTVPSDPVGTEGSDYGIAMMQVMMQQMQQNFMLMMQQMQSQTSVPAFEPPPLLRPRKQLNIEEERAKIRERLAKEREERQSDLRTLSSTLRTSMSLLSKDPSVVSGESLIKPPAEEE